MKRNGLLGAIGAGLIGLAAVGCAHRDHTGFFARTTYNQATGAVDLTVEDEAGINRVEIYENGRRVGRYDLGKFGNPKSHMIETGISRDGNYTFKLFGQNGETDEGHFMKLGERVNPDMQGCF